MENAKKEIRLTEVRAMEEDMTIEGYAIVFNRATDLGWCKEIIDRNALIEADMTDVCMKYNHEDNVLIMARTRNNSLELIEDETGLKVRAKLIDTQNNKDIYKSIQVGLLDKMSFAFTVKEQKWDYEKDLRTITKIDKLFDVSVVDVPAYNDTSIYARSKENYEKEKQEYIESKLELEKQKMLLELSLEQ